MLVSAMVVVFFTKTFSDDFCRGSYFSRILDKGHSSTSSSPWGSLCNQNREEKIIKTAMREMILLMEDILHHMGCIKRNAVDFN